MMFARNILYQSDSDDSDDGGDTGGDVGDDDPGMMLQTSSEESEIEEPHAKKRKYTFSSREGRLFDVFGAPSLQKGSHAALRDWINSPAKFASRKASVHYAWQ